MKKRIALFVLSVMFGVWGTTSAQTQPANGAAAKASVVPNFVRFSGTAKDLNGAPLSGTVGVTFALYENQQGGVPLWLETQTLVRTRMVTTASRWVRPSLKAFRWICSALGKRGGWGCRLKGKPSSRACFC